MDFNKAFKACCSAVGHIEITDFRQFAGENIQGTVFLIHKFEDGKGLFGTAKHVVRQCNYCGGPPITSLEIRLAYVTNGTVAMGVMEIEKIWDHVTHDIAIILAKPAGIREVSYFEKETQTKKIARKNIGADLKKHDIIKFPTNDDLYVGEYILNIGYPEGSRYVFLDDILGLGSDKNIVPVLKHGIISQLIPADNRPTQLFIFDIETVGGMSGSPIIIERENNFFLAGVVTHGISEKDIGVAHVMRFLKELLNDVVLPELTISN